MEDYVKVKSVDSDTVIESGASGGGALIAGKSCSGFYCTSPAILEGGRAVELTAGHWYSDGELVRADAVVSSPDDLKGAEAEGPAVTDWLEDLAKEYSKQD